MAELSVYFDGGARGNPGPAAAGVVVHAGDPTRPIHEAGYFLGHMTNNMAEYNGLLRALDIVLGMDPDAVSIHSDSQLLVQQINGKYRVKSPALAPLYREAMGRLKGLRAWRIGHVRREFNSRADELANLAMDAGHDVTVVSASEPGADDERLENNPESPAATGSPDGVCWDACLTEPPGDTCPASMRRGSVYRFGPTVPEGFCIHAARDVLAVGLTKAGRPMPDSEVGCHHCGAAFKIRTAHDGR